MSYATHRIFPVRGDGNCFYRALFHSARLNGMLSDVVSSLLDASNHDFESHEEAFVEGVRAAVACKISRGHDFGMTRGLYVSLRDARRDKQFYALLTDEFPDWFKTRYPPKARQRIALDGFREFRSFMAASVRRLGNWSFEVDVGIVKRLLDRAPYTGGLEIVRSIKTIASLHENTMYLLLHGDHYECIVQTPNTHTRDN